MLDCEENSGEWFAYKISAFKLEIADWGEGGGRGDGRPAGVGGGIVGLLRCGAERESEEQWEYGEWPDHEFVVEPRTLSSLRRGHG